MKGTYLCFECGLTFSDENMKEIIGDWFGVCRSCNGA